MKNPDFSREQTLIGQGFSLIAGLDEVGRGCWAGPVVAAAVVFPTNLISDPTVPELNQIRDSKTLSKAKREQLDNFIKANASWGIGESTSQEIDTLGITQATHQAMVRAIEQLTVNPDHLLVDGREQLPTQIPQRSIIDGDALCLSIAAASIIAKVYRDQLMEVFDSQHPGYGFAQHVGYGTKSHQLSLAGLGISPIHRRSFAPIRKLI